MKRFIAVLLVLCGISGSVTAAERFQSVSERYFIWSLGALEKVVTDMYNCLEPDVYLSRFQEIVSYLIKHDGVATKRDLLQLCIPDNLSLDGFNLMEDEVNRTVNDSVRLINKPECNDRQYLLEDVTSYRLKRPSGLEQYSRFCDVFLSNLIKQNNKYVKYCNPGTYVKEYKLDSGRTAYKVVDVVLAEGYLSDHGTINQSVNQAYENTGIYLDSGVDDPCSAQRIGTTWTNDSFMRITDGNVRGANTEAYIFLDEDVMSSVDILLREAAASWNLVAIVGSATQGRFDVKNLPQFRQLVGEGGGLKQAAAQVPDNGVVFLGKVCSLDALGHMVFAINNRRIAKTGIDVDTQDFGEWAAEIEGKENQYTKQFWQIGYDLYDSGVAAAKKYKAESQAAEQAAAQAGVSMGNPFVNFHM